jgi:hypothetical protein
MGKVAAVLLALVGLVVLGKLDHDGRLLEGRVGGEVFGLRLQVELTLTRADRGRATEVAPVRTTEACVLPDSVWEVRAWR